MGAPRSQPDFVTTAREAFDSGDRVDDPGSVYNGKHMRNGCKNLGLPRGYDSHPDLMWEAPDQ